MSPHRSTGLAHSGFCSPTNLLCPRPSTVPSLTLDLCLSNQGTGLDDPWASFPDSQFSASVTTGHKGVDEE